MTVRPLLRSKRAGQGRAACHGGWGWSGRRPLLSRGMGYLPGGGAGTTLVESGKASKTIRNR